MDGTADHIAAAHAPALHEEWMGTTEPRRPVVLLVEDDDGVRQSLERYLDRAGYQVLSTADADSAFVTLCRLPVDAVIVDVRLPKNRSGLEVLGFTALGGEHDVLRIVLTGVTLTPEEEDVIRRYPAYVFYKPQGYADIVQVLNARLGDPRARDGDADSSD